jgi:hypothetical protein
VNKVLLYPIRVCRFNKTNLILSLNTVTEYLKVSGVNLAETHGSQLTASWNSGGQCVACRHSKRSYIKEETRNGKQSEWLDLYYVAITRYYYGGLLEKGKFGEACISLKERESYKWIADIKIHLK